MYSNEAIKEVMYQIFNETDVAREKVALQLFALSHDTNVELADVCKIAGTLLWNRIMESQTIDECRGYITELVTILAIHRTELDFALGVTHGTSQEGQTQA